MQSSNTHIGNQIPPNYVPTSDEKTMAILSHILTIIAPIVAPLIIYLLNKDDSKYIEYHARESLNFQLTMMIIIIGLCITIIGLLIVWLVAIVSLVLVLIATINASDGKYYKYPINFRLIKP